MLFLTMFDIEFSDGWLVSFLPALLFFVSSSILLAGRANYDLAVFLKSLFACFTTSNVDFPLDSSYLFYYLTFLGGFFLSKYLSRTISIRFAFHSSFSASVGLLPTHRLFYLRSFLFDKLASFSSIAS